MPSSNFCQKNDYLAEMSDIKDFIAKFTPEEGKLIRSAYEYAEHILAGRMRENGEPFITHPINVAYIVSNEIGLMADAVAAVFLHEGSRAKYMQQQEREDMSAFLAKEFGKSYSTEIVTMVEGLNKISGIDIKETKLNEEVYRKLIVSYSKDPRVTLIKLADRMEVMRHLNIFAKEKIARKNMETIKLYIPLAHKLGMYNLKSEMEDLYFKYSDPENYRLITNKLLATRKERERLAEEFVKPLDNVLKEKYSYKLKIRTKTAYSIWKKMVKQGIPFEGVYDLFAIRFIIDAPLEKEQDYCWAVYSYVTREYEPDIKRLRDWLTTPKPNGYQSLHITVHNREGVAIEVQIRTERMDLIAESGDASHWRYKGIKAEAGFDDWLKNVREMLNDNSADGYKELDNNLLNEIVVFTPAGEMKQLPKGSTVLDFAFNVHSKLGLKCSGAKINGKLSPIRAVLSSGDTVEIMRNKNQKVSADWLSFVVSSRARSRIRAALKEEEGRKSLIGREIIERRLKNWKIDYSEELYSELSKAFKYKTIGDLFIAVNDGSLDTSQIKRYLDEREAENQRRKEEAQAKEQMEAQESQSRLGKSITASTGDYLVINDKLNNVEFKMAKCCNPIFGDDVFGFVTSSKGITIHRMSCPNAARLLERYPYRTQKVKWRQISTTTQFQTTLKVIAEADESLGASIIGAATGQGALLRSFSIEKRNRGNEFNFMLGITVSNNSHLDRILQEIKKVKGVRNILRS